MSSLHKVVLVTGCSSGGIGHHLCEQFAQEGCKVYATSRKVASMEGVTGMNIEKLALDVTSDDAVEHVVQTILDKEGRIDIAVNNAGILGIGPLIDMSLDQIKHTFDTNTFSAFRVAKAVIPGMAGRKSGLIINVGSVVAESPTPWNGLYSSSKAALHTMTEVLWMECKPFNIDVMLVSPASVKSNLSTNHATLFNLPSGSLYTSYLDNIIQRMHVSQQDPMATDVFSKKVVKTALRRKPPFHSIIGSGSFKFKVLRWLPKIFVLWLMWRHFTKK